MSKPAPKSSSKPYRKTLVLLDSHAIIHRAYHALPDFASSKGVPTGALYGLTTMLLGIIEKFKPEYIVACYDLPQPTYRHLAYEGYKAGRKKTDDNLALQLESSRKIFEVFGIPIYDLAGFEADDMLGTIVQQVAHDGKKFDPDGAPVKVVIASGDMDTMQLVTGDDVVVYTLKKGIKDIVIYDELAVLERFGFGPEFLTDYKGLRGDPSDNIIGIAGIGEKTATTLITSFGTIEQMYEMMDKKPDAFDAKLKEIKITDRIRGLIENGRDDALFSKTLATIRRDAPINFEYEHAKWTPHIDQIEALFKELEFRNLVMKVKTLIVDLIAANTRRLDGASKVDASGQMGKIDASDKIGKAGKDGKTKRIGQSEGAKDTESAEQMSPAEPPYQNASTDLQEKLKIAVWVLDSNNTNPTLEDVFYATDELDAEKACAILEKKIADVSMTFVLNTIEAPLIPIVRQMTIDGSMIDIKYLKKLSDEYHKTLAKLETDIHKMAGMEFNIASPKQLGEVLYDKLGLGGAGSGMRIKKTAGGAKSTKESELEKMKDAHPIIFKILEHRELSKLLGTYIDTLPGYADKNDRIHANFSQTGAATGRMSSYDPSVQNIPIKSELGKKIRNAFIAPKGKKLISLDYSQMELRIAAIVSGDKNLIDIFKNNIDVHTGVAARVFKVPEAEVTKDMRRRAKVINFGILYGMGVNALRTNLGAGTEGGIGREEAQAFYTEYFNTFTGIATYLEEVKRSAATLGYTKTIFGRRRYFEGIKSKLPFIRAAAERMAINAPIQGTLADITKLAMHAVHKQICSKPDNAIKLLFQIHDELVFEIDEKKAEVIAPKIQKVMEGVMLEAFEEYKKSGSAKDGAIGSTIDAAVSKDIALARANDLEKNLKQVPIQVSVSIGDNWGEMM